MLKEEAVLFPLMLDGGHPMITNPIAQMRHDHDDHGATLRRIEEITGGFWLPDGACRSWQALNAGAAKLASDLMEHIHLENNRSEEHTSELQSLMRNSYAVFCLKK